MGTLGFEARLRRSIWPWNIAYTAIVVSRTFGGGVVTRPSGRPGQQYQDEDPRVPT